MRRCCQTVDDSVPTCPWRPGSRQPSSGRPRSGATAIQVFGDNPTAWRRRPEPPDDAPAFRERLAERGIGPVAIHAAYLVNLAGPEPVAYERSIEVLAHDLRDGARRSTPRS